MPEPILLSTCGSDRGTAYEMSSKIVRGADALYVGWLEAPAHPGAGTRAMLGICHPTTGALQSTILLGEAYDNHCGPALALDPRDRLHAIVGAHSGAFQYRWSDSPTIPGSWSTPEPLGPGDTYPSLVVDGEGTLHLAHRARGSTPEEHWQLWYRRKRAGAPWEPPVPLAVSPTRGYCNWQQCLALGPSGTLHLLFQFHHGDTGHAQDCQTVAICHLRSPDGGTHWLCGDRLAALLPLEFDATVPLRSAPQGGLAISNLVVDGDGRPWFFAADPEAPTGLLWRDTVEGWEPLPLPRLLPAAGFPLGTGRGSLTRDPQGRLHLVTPAPPDGRPARWYDAAHELLHLVLECDGALLRADQITATDPAAAQWLPALEWFDWLRPETSCADGPWLLYTRGANLGGIGGDNTNALQTRIYLQRLPNLT